MGQEHSLPVGDRDPPGSEKDVLVETPVEYMARLQRQIAEARQILGEPLHSPQPCSVCKAPVYWGQHRDTGKPTCVDAECVEGGNVQLADRNGRIIVTVYQTPPPGTKLRRLHNYPHCVGEGEQQ